MKKFFIYFIKLTGAFTFFIYVFVLEDAFGLMSAIQDFAGDWFFEFAVALPLGYYVVNIYQSYKKAIRLKKDKKEKEYWEQKAKDKPNL